MKKMILTTMLLATGMLGGGVAMAQVAGTSIKEDSTGVSVSQVASGWSVKRTILGADVYDDGGDRIGKVKDLIIATDKRVSYVIIAAGGFVGIGSHDVAIPVTQLQQQGGRLVMPGATKEVLAALPVFDYARGPSRRDGFIARTELDLTRAKGQIAQLEKKADTQGADARALLESKINASQLELNATEARLDELKNATEARWQHFEAGVSRANRRLRQSLAQAESQVQ